MTLSPEFNESKEVERLKLRNGAAEPVSLVASTIIALKSLSRSNPIGFQELVMKARDDSHKMWGYTGNDLVKVGLLQRDHSMLPSVRNIVISSAKGDGLDMKMVSPLAPQQKVSAAQPSATP